MIGMDSNHCQIVEKSLNGQRNADEKTFEAIAVLSERLERLKKLGPAFTEVAFSPHVKKLAKKKNSLVIC